MLKWRRINQCWCNWPSSPIGIIEIIGGSYLSAAPQISYKFFLEELSRYNFAIHTWRYIPAFDHQLQSNQAWKNFRLCKNNLEERVRKKLNRVQIGHSLGCKLHLLSPDGGRNNTGLISISFNNFKASKSIPMLKQISTKFDLKTEFSPNPKQTMDLILKKYRQPKNLLISFKKDKIDQSSLLLETLQRRDEDNSKLIQINGDHLTPASLGLTSNLIRRLETNESKVKDMKKLIEIIYKWAITN